MPVLKIDQIAIAPASPHLAMRLLEEMALEGWVYDTAAAGGHCFGVETQPTANLAFNYTALDHARELEILHYTEGANWIDSKTPCISHFGMHCTAEELMRWRAFFRTRGIPVAQEVHTKSHTNPAIKDTRRYHYVIFHTRPILGVDLKFIVREYV